MVWIPFFFVEWTGYIVLKVVAGFEGPKPPGAKPPIAILFLGSTISWNNNQVSRSNDGYSWKLPKSSWLYGYTEKTPVVTHVFFPVFPCDFLGLNISLKIDGPNKNRKALSRNWELETRQVRLNGGSTTCFQSTKWKERNRGAPPNQTSVAVEPTKIEPRKKTPSGNKKGRGVSEEVAICHSICYKAQDSRIVMSSIAKKMPRLCWFWVDIRMLTSVFSHRISAGVRNQCSTWQGTHVAGLRWLEHGYNHLGEFYGKPRNPSFLNRFRKLC